MVQYLITFYSTSYMMLLVCWSFLPRAYSIFSKSI